MKPEVFVDFAPFLLVARWGTTALSHAVILHVHEGGLFVRTHDGTGTAINCDRGRRKTSDLIPEFWALTFEDCPCKLACPGERRTRRLRPEATHGDPRDHHLVGRPRRGREGAGASSAGVRSASSMRPIRRRRRTSRYRACAAFTRSPCASSVARAASSVFAGQPRSRETSAISASATTHLARATASFGPKARAAFRRRAFARTRSPSCAIAMPRSARAGASSRKATRFNAPSGSPVASARAAAVISESIGIPPHLSLPPFDPPYQSPLPPTHTTYPTP